jgi:DNA-binding NarL/FixJ family response regulator
MSHASVLFVEDNEPVRRSLRDLVTTGYPDLECLEAASGEEAIELAARYQPNVVLMDILMPGLNGIQATREILAMSTASQVVIVSVLDTAAHRADAMSAGAVAYVPKADLGRNLLPLLARLLAANDPVPGSADGENPDNGAGRTS